MRQPLYIMLVGLPGAGKSTLRGEIVALMERIRPPVVTVSSDDLIESYATLQGVDYDTGFSAFSQRAQTMVSALRDEAIRDRYSIIHDQTNLSVRKRQGIIRSLPKEYLKVAVVVQCPEVVRQERLRQRHGKTIHAHIDRQMCEAFVYPSRDEGWDVVVDADDWRHGISSVMT